MSYDLCEELIVEILSRLPTKSLLRFRSVSKSLCACIGSQTFIQLHTLRSPNKSLVMHWFVFKGQKCSKDMYTLHSEGQLSNISVPPVEYPFRSSSIILGSCNGILCVYESPNNDIHLWNPSIRRKVTLHDRPSWSDYTREYVPIGFGFDPIVDDYKILMRGQKEKEHVFIYTVKTDTWREIVYPTTPFTVWTSWCLFNGALHWGLNRKLTNSRDACHNYILTFDLSSEVFSTIEIPEPSWEIIHVTIINGSLAVFSSNHENARIWVRSNSNASWLEGYTLNLHEFGGVYQVFQLTSNDDLLLKCDIQWITIYNPKTRIERRFVGLSGACHMFLSAPYVESLGLLDMGTSCDLGTKPTERKEKQNK